MKTIKFLTFGFALIFSVSSLAMAGGHYGKGSTCPYSGKSKSSSKVCIMSKIAEKAHFIKENQEELGINDDHLDTIKELKKTAKKINIAKKAEMEIVKIDLKSALYEYPVDEAKIKSLIDQKLEIKKSKGHSLATIYAQLKNSLSADQYEKMKSLWHSDSKKSCPHCSKGKSGSCSLHS